MEIQTITPKDKLIQQLITQQEELKNLLVASYCLLQNATTKVPGGVTNWEDTKDRFLRLVEKAGIPVPPGF